MKPKFGDLAGQEITRKNLNRLVQRQYPAYDPEGAITFATTTQTAIEDFVREKGAYPGHRADPIYPQLSAFVTSVKKFASEVKADNYTPEEQANFTGILRRQAIWLAERDPGFYALYGKAFQRYLGPLERVNQ